MLKNKKYAAFVLLILAMLSSSLCAKTTKRLKNTEQQYIYDVSYKSFSVGKITRDISAYNNHFSVSSSAELSFLYYYFGGSQHSQFYWDEDEEQFFAKKFSRVSEGFGGVDMQAGFFDNGHRTEVVNEGVSSEYINKEGKITDFNGIGLALSEGLKKQQSHFDYFMQTSDDVAHYFFEVKGHETIETKFGKLKTIRVEQTQKDDRVLIAWFAPDIHYQMVKFHYKRKLLDISGVLSEYYVTQQ